jgi:glycosyltransferase involved in cell wall biosynthesis
VEAGLNGIPVLASDRGALPDVVGCGGMVASLAAPVRAWAEAAESFLDSSRTRWADAARRNAERFDYSRAIDEFASHVERLAAGGGSSHEPREDSL